MEQKALCTDHRQTVVGHQAIPVRLHLRGSLHNDALRGTVRGESTSSSRAEYASAIAGGTT